MDKMKGRMLTIKIELIKNILDFDLVTLKLNVLEKDTLVCDIHSIACYGTKFTLLIFVHLLIDQHTLLQH